MRPKGQLRERRAARTRFSVRKEVDSLENIGQQGGWWNRLVHEATPSREGNEIAHRAMLTWKVTRRSQRSGGQSGEQIPCQTLRRSLGAARGLNEAVLSPRTRKRYGREVTDCRRSKGPRRREGRGIIQLRERGLGSMPTNVVLLMESVEAVRVDAREGKLKFSVPRNRTEMQGVG